MKKTHSSIKSEKKASKFDELVARKYEETDKFTFKVLRPWIILTEGDTIGASQVLNNIDIINKYSKSITTFINDDPMAD